MSKQMRKTALAKTMYALDHHAAKLKPLVDVLLYSLAGSGATVKWGSSRGGQNSWYMDVTTAKGTRRYYVGWPHSGWRLVIRNSARGPIIASLENERDVLRFVGAL
jgi:hypothetical protein